MEFSFSQLKQKEVISLTDGKNLGKVCDISVSFPESNFLGITVTGCKGFKFTKQEVFISVDNISKIGEDTILVKLVKEKCPPPEKPQPCPPKPPKHCPPPCPPGPPDRRSYDEYE